MNKIVITGCTGAIGIALIKKCLNMGDEVYAIVRPNSKRTINIPNDKKIHIIECDVSSLNELENQLPKCDYFYHLAWSGVSPELRNDPNLQLDNINYTLRAISLASKIGCKKFIGTGSQAEYGIKNELITEETSINPVTGYGIAKYTAGKLGNLYANKLGIEFNWTRIFSVFGPYDSPKTIVPSTIIKMKNNEPIDYYSDGIQLWDFIYSDDCAKALYLVGLKGINGKTYNISSGNSQELKKYIYQIRDIMNSKSVINFNKTKSTNLRNDISLIKNDTGFNPSTTFEEGIRLMLKYY